MQPDSLDSALMKARAARYARQSRVILVARADGEIYNRLLRVLPALWGKPRPGLRATDDDGNALCYVETDVENITAAMVFARRCALEGDRIEPKPRRQRPNVFAR
jgi:hypothetical protein